MSLVPTFVVMDNGCYYKNPIIYDLAGDWYICFDDEEPPEFVIRTSVINSSREKRFKNIEEILEKNRISAIITGVSAIGKRNFSIRDQSWDFDDAIGVYLKLLKRLPILNLHCKHEGIKPILQSIECVVCDPEYKERKNDI